MEENKNILLHSALISGLFLGIFWVFRYLFFAFGSESLIMQGIYLLLFFLPFSLYIVFIETHRFRKTLGGTVSFLPAWAFGVLVYFSAALVLSIPQYLYYTYMVDYDFLESTMEQAKSIIRDLNVNPNTLERIESMSAPTAIAMVLYDIAGSIFQGFIFSLPVAALVSNSSEKNRIPHNHQDN